MPEPLVPSHDTLVSFVKGLPPEVLSKLIETRDAQTAIDLLEGRVTALQAMGVDKRSEARRAYRDKMDKVFHTFDWKKSLAGAPIAHLYVIPGVISFTLRPPTGGTEQLIKRFMLDPGEHTPVSQEELIMLAWASDVQLLWGDPVAPPVDLTRHTPVERLVNLRKLASQTVQSAADRAMDLKSWLSVVLEDELGNS